MRFLVLSGSLKIQRSFPAFEKFRWCLNGLPTFRKGARCGACFALDAFPLKSNAFFR